MTAGELLALFRSEMSDEEEDYLWSDPDVYGYAADAESMFCRKTEGIADASSHICEIEVAEGDEWIDLDPSILKIRAATRASDGYPVEVLNMEDMPGRGYRFDGRTGPLRVLIVGMEEDKARAHEVVSAADTLNLVVFRLPLAEVAAAADEFEIAARHHPHLLHWMKHRAYMKQDAETFDRTKAVEFEQRFNAYCEAVKLEQRNKRHKVRTVSYGGL